MDKKPTTNERIAALERQIEDLKNRLLIAEAKIMSHQTIIVQQPPYYPPQPNPFLPPYIVTC